jgi:DNA-binding response OmpR family regulator
MQTVEPRPLRSVTILLVEDDLDLLELLADYLEARGARVVRAGTFALAQRALALERFDLLVSDIDLPDGNGHDLLAQRRGRVGAAVALTGRRDGDSMDASRTAGFHAHLIKPCDPDILARVAATLTA